MKNKLSIIIFISIITLIVSSCSHDGSSSKYSLSYDEVFPDNQTYDQTVTSITIKLSWKISTSQNLYLYCEDSKICNALYYTREDSGIGFYTGNFQWQSLYVFYLKTETGTTVATCKVPVADIIPNGSSSSPYDTTTASSPNTIKATSQAERGEISLSWLTYCKTVDIYKINQQNDLCF